MNLSEYEQFRAQNLERLADSSEEDFGELRIEPAATLLESSTFTALGSRLGMLIVETGTQTSKTQLNRDSGEFELRCQKLLTENQILKRESAEQRQEILRLREKLEGKEQKSMEVQAGLKNWLRRAKGNLDKAVQKQRSPRQ